jgi:VWFA-related protein
MRPWIRAAASGIVTLLIVLSSVPIPAQVPQLRSRVENVLVPVSARDKNGKLIADLRQSDFTITEAGKKQTVTSFSIDPVPISAAILVDTGITEAALNRVKSSFPALVGAFGEEDEIAIYRFDKYVEKLMDFTTDRLRIERTFVSLATVTPTSSSMGGGPFSSMGPVINGVPVIPGVQSAGRTIAPPTKVLHDAVFQAAEDLSTRGIDRRRVLLVASDGRNQSSQHSYDAALDHLLLNEVQFFGFGVDVSVFQRVRSSLLSYSKATGGDTCFSESQSSLEACYPLSTEDARNQYVLGYVSTNKRPEVKAVFREIKVQVARAGVEVRHRKGYYQSP